MKGIVLSFDRYLPMVDLMIHSYQKLWPGNPFQFRVPYQKYPRFLAEKYGEKVELVQTREAIKPTMEDLLADIGDEEWVYWCLGDLYLIRIDETEITKVYEWVREISDLMICRVMFCRWWGLLEDANLFGDRRLTNRQGQVFIEVKIHQPIWLHQFLRARVLRQMFQSFPDRPFRAKEMDHFIEGKSVPPDQRIFVTEKNMVVFGESTSRGKLTRNGLESLKTFGLEVPAGFEVHRRRLIRGELPRKFLGIPIRWPF